MSWLKGLFNWMKGFKDWLDLILKIVAVIGLLTGIIGFRGCSKQKEEKNNIIEILTSEVKHIETKSGQLATEAKNWELAHKSLSRLYKKDKAKLLSENSRYLKELTEAKQTIEEFKIERKNVQNYIKNELISKDSIRTELVFFDCDNVEIKPIRKKHIQIDFIQSGSFLDIKYQYIANVKTIISRYPELRANGKKHFPNWGFIWGWDYKTTSIIDDPNASISNLVSIEFDK